jgi:hypothetical protein
VRRRAKLNDRIGLLACWQLISTAIEKAGRRLTIIWEMDGSQRRARFHRKVRRTEDEKFGVRAAASGSGAALRAEWRGEQSNLLIF